MEIITSVTQDVIEKAAKSLKNGHLVAFPTETVYGLGADATNENAVSRIYSVKGRPTGHPLIVHISSINQLDKWAIDIPEYAIKLARTYWPGPMTLILKKSLLAKDFVTGGQSNIGVRVPSHPIALSLLKTFENLGGFGIAAPSANRFGAVSPTTGEAVIEELGDFLSAQDTILDGDKCLIGVESTIIDCTSTMPIILRPGAITADIVKVTTNLELQTKINENKIKASGLLDSHYSPKAKIILDKTAKPKEGFIAMSDISTPIGAIRLASPKTNEEYAKVLYASLRLADQKKINTIAIILPNSIGIGDAIRDRITKAANVK
jgi:L-threonylcarbamoyladenylate synthase